MKREKEGNTIKQERWMNSGIKSLKAEKIKTPIISILGILIVGIISATFLLNNPNKKIEKPIDPEIIQSMEYDKVQEKDKDIVGTDKVKFDAFFLRDLTGNGYADSIRGSSRRIGEEDILYMELNVLNEGTFKNGKIKIDEKNIYFQTSIVEDDEIANNYIGYNTTEIDLKKITNGTQKLITGSIRSGNYAYETQKSAAIGGNINNYSQENTVTLTGDYEESDGNIVKIEKTVKFKVDWHGEMNARIAEMYEKKQNLNQKGDINGILDEKNNQVKLNFTIKTSEEQSELNIQQANLKLTMPTFNGYEPTNAVVTGNNIKSNYERNGRILTATNTAQTNESGKITRNAYDKIIENENQIMKVRLNEWNVTVTYPIEAYNTLGADTISYKVPIEVYYLGYNNNSEQKEFTNPYRSNTASNMIIVNYSNPHGDMAIFKVDLGTLTSIPVSKRFISKEKPLRIYNNVSNSEIEDYYTVVWKGYTGAAAKGIMTMEEDRQSQNSDEILMTTSGKESMEDFVSNVGIYFQNARSMLGEEGYIKVIDADTEELIEKFTAQNWDSYDANEPYMYDQPIKHIRIETSDVNPESEIYIYNIKEIDDNILINKFDKSYFDTFKAIQTTINGKLKIGHQEENINTDKQQAIYDNPISKVDISLGNSTISTQRTEKNLINIDVNVEKNHNFVRWNEGAFLVKLPSEIINLEIENIDITGTEVEIISYEKYEEEGNIYIKILTTGEATKSFSIPMDVQISVDPRKVSTTAKVELYASNETCNEYITSTEDIYDVNGNTNTMEKIGKAEASLAIIAPGSLLTGSYATEFDNKDSVVVAPKIAVVDKGEKTAKINVFIKNNYKYTISEIKLLGRIPSENNTYVLTGGNLGSTFDATLNGPIQVPSIIGTKAKVYYSEKVDATEDLKDINNKWIKQSDVTSWKNIKSYLIDLGDYKLPTEEPYNNCEFSYNITIPDNLEYNEVSYSHHAVYFCLDTEAGKYRTQTEPNKLGFMITKQYDLQITKRQKDSEKIVPGATYMAMEENAEEGEDGIIGITGKDGIATLKGLLAEKNYIIKEIRSPKNYEINTEEIKITTRVTEEGEIEAEKISGTSKQNLEVSKEDDSRYIIKMQVEDEIQANLEITKTDNQGTILPNIVFKLKGYGIQEKGKEAITNKEGKINLTGICLNKEYTLEEVKADGYYLVCVKFRIIRQDGQYKVEILSQENSQTHIGIKAENITTTVTNQDEIPNISMNIKNEKIPTYELKIKKVKKDDIENKGLSGARYAITSEDTKETKYYTSTVDGSITIPGLYNYVAGKYITGKYTLKELRAPEGYAITGEEVTFWVSVENEEMTINFENERNLTSVKEYNVQGNTVNLILQDNPIFSIKKVDKVTNLPLQNAIFTIEQVDKEKNVLGYAQTPEGEKIGKENENQQYVVKTDENGEITTPIKGGFYKLTEIEAPEGYELPSEEERVQYFTIEGFEDLKINYIEDLIKFTKDPTYYSSGKVISLARDLDFTDPKSYRDPTDATTYPDYNGDGNQQGIKEELTNQSGRGFISSNASFSGTFLGNDYCIKNIYINNNNLTGVTPNYGFFITINTSGKVSNLGITGEYVYNNASIGATIGGFVNYNYGTIENCYSEVNITVNAPTAQVGGFAVSNAGTLINCHNKGNIKVTTTQTTGDTFVGGIAPVSNVIGCYNEGNITVESKNNTKVGGITGDGAVERCYNTGKIVAYTSYVSPKDNWVGLYVGGISGILYKDVDSNVTQKISNCENRGEVEGGMTTNTSTTDASIGGIVGYNSNGIVENCSNKAKITANGINIETVGGISGYLYGDNGKVINCFNTGEINGTSSNNLGKAGGIIGDAFNDTAQKNIIANCYNTGNITGSSGYSNSGYNGGTIGGIVGFQQDNIIINTYNTGIIKGIATGVSAGSVGGIVGDQEGEIYNSYNTAQIIYQGNNEYGAVGGIAGYAQSSGIARNCYTTGRVSGTGKYYIGAAIGYGWSGFVSSNIYYMSGTASNGCGGGSASTTMESSYEMQQTSFINTLNNNRSSIDSSLSSASVTEKTTEWIQGDPYPTLKLDINVDTTYTPSEEETITTSTNIEVKNSLKKYDITTEIGINSQGVRQGGNITGSLIAQTDRRKVEEVEHGKNALINIEVTPDPGYIIKSIKLDEKEIKYTVDKTGKAILPLLENVTENHHYVVIFENTIGQIIVHHYEDGTGKDGVEAVKVAEDEVETGKIGESYNKGPKVDIPKYEPKSDENGYIIPAEAHGKYEANIKEITFYYVKSKIPLTVHHYIDGTQNAVPLEGYEEDETQVAKDVTKEGSENEAYTTEALTEGADESHPEKQILNEKYKLKEEPANARGEYKYDEVVVTYLYELKDSAGVHVTYVDKNTKREIAPSVDLPEGGGGKVGDSYVTKESNQIPPNYKLDKTPSNATGEMTEGVTNVVYEYVLKDPQVVSQETTKEALNEITSKEEPAKYEISYKAIVSDYIGKVQIVVVDKLPGKIDKDASELQGGEYSEENNTITWKEVRDINTYEEDDGTELEETKNVEINFNKEISLVFTDLKGNEEIIENIVNGKVKFIETEKESEEEEGRATTTTNFKIDVKVEKVWSDAENIAEKRPTQLNIILKNENAEPQEVDQITLNQNTHANAQDSNKWEYTFEDLPKYNEDGTLAKYTVEERAVGKDDLKFYETQEITETENIEKITQNTKPTETTSPKTVSEIESIKTTKIFTITNTFNVPNEEVEVQAVKVWDHTNNIYTKPSKVKLQLMKKEANGNKTAVQRDGTNVEVEISRAENKVENLSENLPNLSNLEDLQSKISEEKAEVWSYTFRNLPKYDNLGNEIDYCVDETEAEGESLAYYEKSINDEKNIITNTYIGPVITSDKTAETQYQKEYVVKGEEITYTITVENSGSVEKEVTIRDNLPEEVEFESGTIRINEETEYEVNGVQKTLSELGANDLEEGIRVKVPTKHKANLDEEANLPETNEVKGKIELSFKVKVKEEIESGKIIKNQATVDNNETESTENKVKAPSITTEKTVSIAEGKDFVVKGDTIKYTITIRNKGDLGENVVIKDSIPEGTEFVEGSIRVNDGETQQINGKEVDMAGKAEEELASGIIVYVGPKTDDLIPGVTTLSFEVKVKEEIEEKVEGDIKNKAKTQEVGESEEVPGSEVPGKPEEETEEVKTPVVTFEKQAQITRIASVEKGEVEETEKQKLEANEVTVGDEITYKIIVKNTGSKQATNIEVKDTIPEGTTYKESTENPEIKEKQLKWTIENLEEGETKTLSFTVIVNYSQTDIDIRNKAYVSEKATNETVTKYKNPEIKLETNIVKDGAKTITDTDTKVYYEINYTAKINNFVGRAILTIVDKLPYEIDEENSEIPGNYVYNKEEKTITWTEEINDIDTYKDTEKASISRTKSIQLKYMYEDEENLSGTIENTVTGTIELKRPNPEKEERPEEPNIPDEITALTDTQIDTHEVNVEIPGKVTVHHYFYDAEKQETTEIELVPDEEKTGKVGDKYTTSKSNEVPQNYECKNENPEGKEGTMTKTPKEVTYYYTLKDEAITNEISKTVQREENVLGPEGQILTKEDGTPQTKQVSVEVLTDEDGEVTYTIKYKVTIRDYIGKAKITIVDNLPASINQDASSLADGNYNPLNNTITWEQTIENINTYEEGQVDESHPEYGKVENGTYEVTIEKTIKLVYDGQNVAIPLVNTVIGKVTTYYPDEIQPTKPEEKKTEEKQATSTVEQEYKVDKIVEKRWDDSENAKGHRPNSVKVQLTANGVTSWDNITLPNTQENDVENTYTGELPITILSEENHWTHTFENLPKYDESGTLISYSIVESEVEDGELDYYEQEPEITTEDESIQETETKQVGKIIVTNKYRLTNTEVEGSITKQGTSEITKSNQEVNYSIRYNAVIKDYVGKAIVTITDTLPYKIDLSKSDIKDGKYDETTKTITWTENLGHINTIEEANNQKEVTIQKEIKVVYQDLGENLTLELNNITNKVKGKIEFTEKEEKNEKETSYDTNVNVKGKLIVKYVDKDTGKEIVETIEPGQPGNEDGTEQIEKKYSYETEEKVGTPYYKDQKEIYGYDFVEDSGNTQGEITEGTIEVTYYYARKDSGGVTAKYVDEDGNEIAPEEKIEGKVGDTYKTEDKNDELDNYEFAETTGDAPEGKLEEDAKEVVYHYRKLTAKVIVRYLEKGTNTVLLQEKVIEGKVGDSYETSREVIEGYRKAGEEPENANGKMIKDPKTNNTIYVTYYYEKIPSGKITVKYLDKETGEEITRTIKPGEPGNEEGKEDLKTTYAEELQGYVGERYETKEKEIPYYKYLEELAPTNKEGLYKEDNDTVIYYYQKLNFNFSVEKRITEASIDGKQAKVDDEGKIIKLEVVAKKVTTSKVEVKYEVLVKNNGEIEGTAKIKETLPEGFKVANNNPSYWEEQTDGTLITEVKLNPGQSENLEVVAIWKNGNNNFGTMRNQVQITDTTNPANYLDSSKNDNESQADVVMSIKTGAEQKVLGVALGTIATAGLLILLYQYQKYQKERNREIRHVVLDGKNVVIKKKKQK